MASSVIHLRTSPRPPAAGEARTVAVPHPQGSEQRLHAALDEAGAAYDARAIWLGYPSLGAAADRLAALISLDWPSRTDPGRSAAVDAALQAIREVSQGVEKNESSRDLITANFLHGLASVADDVAATLAWGFRGGRPVECFEALAGAGFEGWCRQHALTQVRFFITEGLSASEVEGTRLKLLCAVAGARDVGIAMRHRGHR